MNSSLPGAENVHVVCRCRPFSEKEKADGYNKCVAIDQDIGSISITSQKRDQELKTFSFDAVFDESSTQRDVYNKTACRIVEDVLNGFNGTIFCYGQTGTGKTFTMQGIKEIPEQRGIIINAFHHIFDFISQSSDKQFLVRISFLEIYNEEIRDLLVKSNQNPKGGLELKEHPETGVFVKDLSAYVVKSVAEMDRLMDVGNKNRSTGATLMNEHSSRSHSIFSITVESSEKGPDGEDHFKVGKLHLVDLAGSERQSKTGATGERFKEATRINLSLSALGNCISSLVDGKSSHIPYRDSKLTRLLQDSLGGNSKTLMIATLSPASYNFEETLSTLRYANRAKNIKNKPKINEDPKDAMLRQMQEEIQRLKKELESKQKGEAQIITKVLKKVVTKKVQKVVKSKKMAMDGMLADEYSTESLPNGSQEPANTLDMSLEELQKQVELERSKLKDFKDEEAEEIKQELEKRAIELEKEKQEAEALHAQLAAMEGQLILGGTHIEDRIQEQELEILKAQKELQEKAEKERRLQEQLEVKQEQQLQMEENYASLQEEIDIKTRKLKKILSKIDTAKSEINDLHDEFRNEKEDMLDAIRELKRERALACSIIENFIPVDELKKVENRIYFDQDKEEWQLRKGEEFKESRVIKKSVATQNSKRPLCLYAKRAMLQKDPSPRYRPENILNIGLDLPERMTLSDLIPRDSEEAYYPQVNAFDALFGIDFFFNKKMVNSSMGPKSRETPMKEDPSLYPNSKNASKMPKARYS